MNVLCIPKKGAEGAMEPLKRAGKALVQHGVKIEFKVFKYEEQVEAFDRYFDYDLVFMMSALCTHQYIQAGFPTILYDRVDGAQLAKSRKFLKYPNVLAAIKNYAHRDYTSNCIIAGRFHSHLLWEQGLTEGRRKVAPKPPQQVSEENLKKICVGYGFGAYTSLDKAAGRKADLRTHRPIDLHCCIGSKTDPRSEIKPHRELALRVAKKVKNSFCGHDIPGSKYLSTMCQAKAVLSPWGYGEACYRDYEAILCGAILIKPDTSYVESWPDIYQPGKLYVPCKLDFSDLPSIVEHIRANWYGPHYYRMQKSARKAVLEARKPKAIAARFAKIFKRCLESIQ